MAASYIMNDSVNIGLTSSYAIVNDPTEEVINAMNFDSQVLEMEFRDGQNVFDFAESIGNGMASAGLSNFPETKAPSATMMTGVSGPASSDISAGIDSGSLVTARATVFASVMRFEVALLAQMRLGQTCPPTFPQVFLQLS
ncbi:hypothetical protein MY3296_008982 [Beauveria thailandica]